MVHISLVTAGLVLVLIQLSQGRYLSYMILSQMSSYTNMFYLSVFFMSKSGRKVLMLHKEKFVWFCKTMFNENSVTNKLT